MPQLLPRARASQESVFARMSRLAAQYGAVNLGQGFPADAPPAFLLDAARRAVGTLDQYSPPAGLPALRDAIGADLGVDGVDVIVTCGATEALNVLALALYGPRDDGSRDEVLMLEPVFDVYLPQARLAGATPVTVPMTLDLAGGWSLDLAALRAAVTPRTRALLLNSPYNPTGTVFSREELTEIVALAREHDLWIISDEVYDELYFGEKPLPMRELAPERTFTVGSAGKRLEATGWRVGWIACPPGQAGQGVAANVAGVRQQGSFCAPTPLQAAVAAALPVARAGGYYEGLRAEYRARQDLLAEGLRGLGATVFLPQGTYFLTAIHPEWRAETLVQRGVAVIPGEAFYAQHPAPEGLLRVAFCKSRDEIAQALERLSVVATTPV
ncbi:pyridoxal phosphate-dependent aminotransferase [Deinococcus radiopugnans]|uniref:N-succinyldiaminopimelate aminotransferase n=1 Tax=Deinococcus radiopugnans ATCC 19172 TaxID=585398 RepID=A0A5C4Y791_9DEIO|nr:pyridoxal phosphate-dependent aminotransferase [Deinococcus radiopugnans]MBB6016342.1 N-succinyldiaminopimelate aminotransferase [Deinococcus radiopugnans ATCC 19172]TNM71307.1 pyridoxal phosphate-dependent aminotransferase [Deinococcus radiopugnans ATCC 19172]